MDVWMVGQTDGRTEGWINDGWKSAGWMDEWVSGWMCGETEDWMDGAMDEWMDDRERESTPLEDKLAYWS